MAWPSDRPLPAPYRAVDQCMKASEPFHGLRFHQRIRVVECRDWPDFQRFMPIVQGRSVGAVTLLTGTVVYVTAKLVIKFEFVPWLYEGAAVLAGDQQALLWPLLPAWLGHAFCVPGLAILSGRPDRRQRAGSHSLRCWPASVPIPVT